MMFPDCAASPPPCGDAGEGGATGPSPSPADPLALDAAGRAWVEKTRDALSAEAKIAQLFILAVREDSPEEAAQVAACKPGGVHRFPGHDLQRAWETSRWALDIADIPPLLSGDIEGGMVSYGFATAIPNQLGIAACADLGLTERLARLVAVESRALGYDWSFTPVVDIDRAFRNPVVGTRSYGSDPDMVLAQARAYVRVLQSHGMAATAKHWPGDGIDDRDQHLTTTVNSLTFEDWEASFGRVFRGLVAEGVTAVMSAHIALPAFVRALDPAAGREAFRPASVSRLLNQILLRERLGFQGLVVSDATVMGGLTSWADRAEAVPAVIENGCDMFLFSRDAAADMRLMLDGLRNGRLSEARLEEAVTRALSLKARLGLHRRPPEERLPSPEAARERLRSPANLGLAAEAAGRSLTLVKDVPGLLPLDPIRHRRVVVVADQGRSFFSGALERTVEPFHAALRGRGFEPRAYDPEAMPTADDTDLVVYLAGQEATPALSRIYLDWERLHGGPRKAMVQFNREIPTLLVSLGQPYYLYDAPAMGTYVNAYSALPSVQIELVRRLVGEAPFTGRSPVDPFCGLEQLRW